MSLKQRSVATMKRRLLSDPFDRKNLRGGRKKLMGCSVVMLLLLFLVGVMVYSGAGGGTSLSSYDLLLDSMASASASLSSSPKQGGFSVSLPPFGTCERSLAEYFLRLDYGYERTRLQKSQAHRDRDLMEMRVVDIFDSKTATTHRWVGNHFNTHYILEFAQKVIQPFQAEWSAFPNNRNEAADHNVDYYRNNGMHEGSDPIILHSFVRGLKPARVLEIGSGFSSRVTTAALERNQRECGGQQDYEFIAIDPQGVRMAKVDGKVVGPQFHESWIEGERLAFVVQEFLQAGDLLFIDSSHVLGGGEGVPFFTDVIVEYAEILPRLPPGVFVHVHDIAFPVHHWFYERKWAELFVLRALLLNNPYFDIIWSGGALNLLWAELEDSNMSLEDVRQKVESVRKAALAAVGPHLHVHEVGPQRPFAGGGSIWLRRNMRPYPRKGNIPAKDTIMEFLKSPKRDLVGVDLDQNQLPFLQELAAKYKDHATCAANARVSDCVVCAFLSETRGTVHVYDQSKLASLCPKNVAGNSIISHTRQEILNTPLKSFTALTSGDSIVLSDAHMLGYKRNDATSLASILFVLEIAPRLASGINIVFYGGLIRDVSDLVNNKRGHEVGTFLTQAWLTMNDAVDVIWYEDSDNAAVAGFGGNPDLPSDHVVILRTR